MSVSATFTRASVAYKQDGSQVASGVPRFETGKFGQAIMVEEGTTNLVVNPSFDTNTASWQISNGTTSNGAITRVTSDGVIGTSCLEYTITTFGAWRIFYNEYYTGKTPPIFDVAKQYTLTFWAKNIAGDGLYQIGIMDPAALNIVKSLTGFTATSVWTKFTYTFTPLVAGNTPVLYFSCVGATTSTKTLRIDAVQVEQKDHATSFSSGTRDAESPTIPTAGLLNTSEGTIEFWYVPKASSSQHPHNGWAWLFGIGTTNDTDEIRIAVNNSKWYVQVGNKNNANYNGSAAATFVADQPVHVALTWAVGETAVLYINGVPTAIFTTGAYTLASVASIGYSALWGAGYRCNGLIDEMRFYNRALTADEISQCYGRQS